MPDVVTFDPVNLRIIEIDTGGDNSIDVAEVYSEWKDWLLNDVNNMHFPQAFRVLGGEPISQTENLGSTFFLLNGWRFRPAETDHRVTLNGNLFTDPFGDSIFVPTLGNFTVNAELKVSSLVTGISSTAIRDSVLTGQVEGNYTLEELMRLMSAVLLGKASGGPDNSVFRDVNDTKDRVTSTSDSSGNRTNVVVDET